MLKIISSLSVLMLCAQTVLAADMLVISYTADKPHEERAPITNAAITTYTRDGKFLYLLEIEASGLPSKKNCSFSAQFLPGVDLVSVLGLLKQKDIVIQCVYHQERQKLDHIKIESK